VSFRRNSTPLFVGDVLFIGLCARPWLPVDLFSFSQALHLVVLAQVVSFDSQSSSVHNPLFLQLVKVECRHFGIPVFWQGFVVDCTWCSYQWSDLGAPHLVRSKVEQLNACLYAVARPTADAAMDDSSGDKEPASGEEAGSGIFGRNPAMDGHTAGAKIMYDVTAVVPRA